MGTNIGTDKVFQHARKLEVEKIINSLVKIEDMSVESIALILCKLYKSEIDDVILEVCRQRQNLLFFTALKIAEKLRFRIFISKLLHHIDEGTDQEFLSKYSDDGGFLLSLLEINILYTLRRSYKLHYKQHLERQRIRNAFKKVLPSDSTDLVIRRIKDSAVSVEQAAEIIKNYMENDDSSEVSFSSLFNMKKLSLSVSENEEEKELAAKIDKALKMIKPKENVMKPITDKKHN